VKGGAKVRKGVSPATKGTANGIDVTPEEVLAKMEVGKPYQQQQIADMIGKSSPTAKLRLVSLETVGKVECLKKGKGKGKGSLWTRVK